MDKKILRGLCQCGCGELAPIAERTRLKRGWVKGKPKRFIPNHYNKGSNNGQWRGGRTISGPGYIKVLVRNHPRADQTGYVSEQYLIVEAILGKVLPLTAVVHHINGIKTDNRPANLVVCQNQSYHNMLHRRERAFKVCGHANWGKCHVCKQYDAPLNLKFHGSTKNFIYHQICKNAKQREYRKRQHGKMEEKRRG